MTDTKILPVILSGGAGTRLWPMSRAERPKQFLPLAAERTMFQETLARVQDQTRFAPPLIVANAAHKDLIETQFEGEATVLLEPAARNTAAAIALAALLAAPEQLLLVMPSDHVIAELPAFHAGVAAAEPFARDGWLVTFGIEATEPETGYGYIKAGAPLGPGVQQVERFVEKPELAHAQAMLAEGNHSWNGGIFLFRADAYLTALGEFAPEILQAARSAMEKSERSGNCVRPDAEAFARSPSQSVDYAVMEHARRVAVVPVAMGWSDLGSWDSLHGLHQGGDAHEGDVIAIDTRNCLLHSDGIRIAAVGVEDLIVVASGSDVLILPKGRSQEVKRVFERLESKR